MSGTYKRGGANRKSVKKADKKKSAKRASKKKSTKRSSKRVSKRSTKRMTAAEKKVIKAEINKEVELFRQQLLKLFPELKDDVERCKKYKGESKKCRTDNCYYNYDWDECLPRMRKEQIAQIKII